jgi:electron transport complex protein RnfA
VKDLLWIFVGTFVVNNFTLSYFLGLCPFFGVSGKLQTAFRLGLATTFVMLITALATWALNTFVLVDFPYLRLLSFIVVIASAVQFVEMVIKKLSPALFAALGIFLPLITTNCAVLGVALLNVQGQRGLLESLVYGAGAGAGFGLALLLFAALRERLEACDLPAAFRGAPIALVTAGLMALAFMGFAGLGSR